MSDIDLFESLSHEMCNLKVAKEAEAIIAIDARVLYLDQPIFIKKPLIFARNQVNCLEN